MRRLVNVYPRHFSENRSEYYCSESRMGGTKILKVGGKTLKLSTRRLYDRESGVSAAEIKAIGISYQMHGLVCVDKNQHVLRPLSSGVTPVRCHTVRKRLRQSGRRSVFLIC